MCTRSDIPKFQQRERTLETLKGQERHTLKIDQDGDVDIDEWANSNILCVRIKLFCFVILLHYLCTIGRECKALTTQFLFR
jgi:hypothetical protein